MPRLWTPPLRDLTPDTSYGYDVVDFADQVLSMPLDPWEQWLAIHVGELLPDGRPRFRVILVLVGRQNGKTLVAKVFALYWMFVDQVPLVLGTSTSRDYAKRVWLELCEHAQRNPLLAAELGARPVYGATGEETLLTAAGSRYKFAATNRRAGRSLTVHRLLLDELREHHNWDAWNAATHAMNAVVDGQVLAITNQGDDESVVLDALREPALTYLETGEGDPRLGLFEWSAPDGADPTDPDALAAGNPNLGRRIDPDAIMGAARRAKAAGGDELAHFRTEVLCQRVHQLDPAIDPDAWTRAGTDTPASLANHRRRVALCIDVALDGSHATLAAAAVIDGVTHVEIVAAWSGVGCLKAVRTDLPGRVDKVRPRVVGWFPAGPAAALAADIRPPEGRRGWVPRATTLEEIRGDTAAVCMGFADAVLTGQVRHPRDDMLDLHVRSTQRLWRGDTWVYTRRGASPIDGTYAAAGAVHLARTLPPPLAPLQVIR